MRCFLSHYLSLHRYRAVVRLFLRRWLRTWRGLAGREALARLRGRRFIVLRLESLEERVVPAATQEALTQPAPLGDYLTTTSISTNLVPKPST